jgi:hypothetical protein
MGGEGLRLPAVIRPSAGGEERQPEEAAEKGKP